MKKTYTTLTTSLGLCAGLCLLATRATANEYFDVNGATSGFGTTTGGSYSWDANNWSTSSAGTAATTAWPGGNFPRFLGAGNYTVTANASESMAGMYQDATGTLTVNSAGSGNLSIVTGDQGFLVLSGGTLILNTTITGTGGLAPENSGTMYVNGNNNYSGGTTFGYGTEGLVYFDNNNSFGTGTIKQIAAGVVAPMLAYGGATITLPNNFQNTVANGGFNFAASASTPLVLNGGFSLSTFSTLIKNNGNNTSPLTINGVISGSAGTVSFAGNNGGLITLNGVNTHTGIFSIGASGATAVTVKLGVSHAVDTVSSLVMAGGTLNLDPAGSVQNITGTLGLTASSTIDFGGVAGTITLGNSSGNTWAGTLNVINYNPNIDTITIGTDNTGLTSGQQSDIVLDGGVLGPTGMDSFGDIVPVPEPSALVLGALGGIGMLWMVKRRKNA